MVSNDRKLLEYAKHLTTQAKSDTLYYTHDEIGYNYRMTNLQAALGLAQLEKLEHFIEIKTINFEHYMDRISCIDGLKLLDICKNIRSNHWFYTLYCDERYKMKRDKLLKHLDSNNIQARPIWGLIHKQKPYQMCVAYKIEKAEDYWVHAINIPCSTSLTPEQLNIVVQCLEC